MQGQVESEAGAQGEQGGGGGGGGGGREVAQVEREEGVQVAQAAAGEQPAELAQTGGVNTGALVLIGVLCVAASLLLFRRRRTA